MVKSRYMSKLRQTSSHAKEFREFVKLLEGGPGGGGGIPGRNRVDERLG